MLHVVSRILIVLTGVMFAIHFLFTWMNSQMDVSMFHAFAHFLRTGMYINPFGIQYSRVHTGSPPLYSVLLAIIYPIPGSDIVLHGIQLATLAGTGILLYWSLKRYIGKEWAVIVSCLFLWIPGNSIFVTYVLSDLGAQFLFAWYTFLLYRFLSTKQAKYLSESVLVGFLTGLWRYSFVVYGLLSLVWLLYKLPKRISIYIPAVLGIIVISGWILFQHNLSGVWGLANDMDIRYNIKMMMQAKTLPSENHPSMIVLRQYIPKDVDLRKPYWDLEPYLVPAFGYDYVRMTKLVGDVGKAAVVEHPFVYLKVTAESFFQSHTGAPHTKNVGRYGRDQSDEYPPQYCGEIERIQYCKPIIFTTYSYSVWNAFVDVSQVFYKTFFPFWSFVIFFPLLVWSLFSANAVLRLYGILFLIGRIPIAMATWTDPRYVLPFYPLMVLITCLGILDVASFLRRKK